MVDGRNRCRIFLVLVLFFSLLFTLFCLLFLLNVLNPCSLSPSNYIDELMLLEIDPSSNQVSYGYVSLPRDEESNAKNFFTYQNEVTGSSIFLSPFSETEYECVGSCYCADSFRRGTFTPLTHSLSLLFFSFSLSLATSIAQHSFRQSCLHQFSESCPQNDISSEVDSCSPLKQTEEIENQKITNVEVESEEENGDWMEYDCHGHCVRNGRVTSKEGIQAQKDFGSCESLQASGKVKVFQRFGSSRRNLSFQARLKFKKEVMVKFCKVNSRVRFRKFHPAGDRMRYEEASLCVSKSDNNYATKNIKCFYTKSQLSNVSS